MKLYESSADREAGPILCRPAETRADYCAAFRLVYRRYLAAGLIPPNPSGMRITPHQLRPGCTVILAEVRDQVVGTVSLMEDGPSKLPMDRLFPETVNGLRRQGISLTEIGCLAALDDSHQFPSLVYIELTRATIHYSRLGGFDRMIAAVHPRHGRFYRRAMGFERLTGEARYALVNDNAAVCVCGDPNDPQAYREPWRGHFFSGPWTGGVRRGRPLPATDLRYFESLREVIESSSSIPARRAA